MPTSQKEWFTEGSSNDQKGPLMIIGHNILKVNARNNQTIFEIRGKP